MKKVELSIKGMACNGCVKSVEKVLGELGASDISVSLEGACASFQVADEADVSAICAAIEETGFGAQVK